MEPEVVSVHEARRMTGLGNTKIYELIADGALRTCKIGRRRLVKLDSIRELVASSQVAA